MVFTSLLLHNQSCVSRTTLLSGFVIFSDDASRLINIASPRACMSGIVPGGAEEFPFPTSIPCTSSVARTDQAASISCWRIQIRPTFLSQAATHLSDNTLSIRLRIRLSKSFCAFSGEKPPGISIRNSPFPYNSCNGSVYDHTATIST